MGKWRHLAADDGSPKVGSAEFVGPVRDKAAWREGWTRKKEGRKAVAREAERERVIRAAVEIVAPGEMLRLVEGIGLTGDAAGRLALALESIAQTGNIQEAAKISGLSAFALMSMRASNTDLDKLWSLCEQLNVELLYEPELGKRARGGAEDKGSIPALKMLLEGTRPQKYGKHVNVNGAVTHDHVMQTVLPKGMKSKFKDVPGRQIVYELGEVKPSDAGSPPPPTQQ